MESPSISTLVSPAGGKSGICGTGGRFDETAGRNRAQGKSSSAPLEEGRMRVNNKIHRSTLGAGAERIVVVGGITLVKAMLLAFL